MPIQDKKPFLAPVILPLVKKYNSTRGDKLEQCGGIVNFRVPHPVWSGLEFGPELPKTYLTWYKGKEGD